MTFDFTLDAFPGYTYFDKTKKVLCVVQIIDSTIAGADRGRPVMPHTDELEHGEPNADGDVVSDILDLTKDNSTTNDSLSARGKDGTAGTDGAKSSTSSTTVTP